MKPSFGSALDALINEYLAEGAEIDDIISELDFKLLALNDERAADDENEEIA